MSNITKRVPADAIVITGEPLDALETLLDGWWVKVTTSTVGVHETFHMAVKTTVDGPYLTGWRFPTNLSASEATESEERFEQYRQTGDESYMRDHYPLYHRTWSDILNCEVL